VWKQQTNTSLRDVTASHNGTCSVTIAAKVVQPKKTNDLDKNIYPDLLVVTSKPLCLEAFDPTQASLAKETLD
jgi:hypothetical protein